MIFIRFEDKCRLSVDTETLMTAAERVLEYCALDQEPIDVAPPRRPLPETPSSFGEITFENVLMHHSPDAKSLPALRHITLKIHSAEKIGIIGRTGAGKSSFIQALFRMGTLTEGRILIDGVDIAALGLTDLRSRVSVIPQDPVLFTGSVKSNLDPFGRYSDDEIMAVLDQVNRIRFLETRFRYRIF